MLLVKNVLKMMKKITLAVDDKLKAWQLHYQKLLNVEFLWNDEPPVEGPAIKITTEMVLMAINKTKSGKAAETLGIIIEIIKTANNGTIDCTIP